MQSWRKRIKSEVGNCRQQHAWSQCRKGERLRANPPEHGEELGRTRAEDKRRLLKTGGRRRLLQGKAKVRK